MSASYVEWRTSDALTARLDKMLRVAKGEGPEIIKFRRDIKQIVIADNADKLLKGVDKNGNPLAPLAPSTLKNPRRGSGPPLIPRGARSRFITNFEVTWEIQGSSMALKGRYVNILSKSGRSFVQYHLNGTSRLPKRDVAGITPKGWQKIRERQHAFVQEIAARDAATVAQYSGAY